LSNGIPDSALRLATSEKTYCFPDADKKPACFAELHLLHAVTRLPAVSSPPDETGNM
jgi:hypothetical protein